MQLGLQPWLDTMYDVPRPRWRQRFLPCVRCVLLAYLAGSLCFAWWPSRPTRLVRNAGRTYQLLPTKKLEQERALLTQPVHREVAPGVFNPLLDELNGIPRLEKVRSEHLVSAVDLVLEQFQSDLRRIQSSLYKKMALQQQRLSYEEVLGPVEILLDRVEKVWGAIHFLRRAWRISPKIDEIYHQLSYRLSTAASILAQSDFLHEALRQLSEQDLSPVQRRVVMRLAREGFTMGVGIEDPKTLRSLEEGTKRLAQLATVFSQNVAQDEEQVLLRASRDEIKGLSQKVLNVLNTGDGEEFWLTSQREACEAYGRDAENADVRRKAFLAARRLGSGNLPVIAEMLRIRQDWAAVLGYRNFADLVFEARSASKAEVEMLLQALRESSEAAAVEELKDLKTFADEDLRVWDIDHVRSKMKQSEFEEAQLEPYLPLTGVIRGLFKLIERLFNVRLETATSRREVPLWHRSIRFYRVVDVDSQHPIAGLYLDLFQHGKKLRSGGFWSDSFVSFSKRLGNNQDVRRPIAHIVGDLPPPADGPNLLSLREVRSLFNAAGGALQHLLNQQEEGLASPENMEMDAALLPNFMEQWAMDPSTLQSFGGHWETGEVIPDHLLQAMKAQAKHGALDLFQKVSWAQLDLELHSQDLSEDGIDGILEVARAQLASEEIASVLPDFNDAVEEGLCNFHGPFSTGFAAGEYVRIWKEVLVADLFEAFQNQDGDVSTGKRMRELFLAPGADVSPTALVRELRGRGPKVGPFLKQLGLSRLKVLRLASVTHMKMSCPQMSADVNSLG